MAEKYGYQVVGVDYSRVGCELLKANLVSHTDNALVVQGNIFQNCFCPGTFDMVFSYGFIEHFTNYSEILALFRAWLKPGGLLITLVPNKRYFFRHVERWIAPDVFDAHVPLKPKDLEDAYRQIGLEDIRSSYLGSFSTWKYVSKTEGMTQFFLRIVSRALCLPVHTLLRASGLEPESKMFSPLIFAIGKIPANP
jgi:cyclopropane fatty-acyl-phospholipid synthase-like methyltransferase